MKRVFTPETVLFVAYVWFRFFLYFKHLVEQTDPLSTVGTEMKNHTSIQIWSQSPDALLCFVI